MTIGSVNKSNKLYAAQADSNIKRKYQSQDDEKKIATKSNDKLELSAEAKKLSPIRQKIDSGFYNKNDVLKDVAMKLSKQFNLE